MTAFEAVPSYCTVNYSSSSAAFNAASLTWTWTDVNSISETSIASPFYIDRSITVTASSYTYSQSASFSVRIKNPCVDSSYNPVTVPADKKATYTVNDEVLEISFTDEYRMQLNSICGVLEHSLIGLTTEIKQLNNII